MISCESLCHVQWYWYEKVRDSDMAHQYFNLWCMSLGEVGPCRTEQTTRVSRTLLRRCFCYLKSYYTRSHSVAIMGKCKGNYAFQPCIFLELNIFAMNSGLLLQCILYTVLKHKISRLLSDGNTFKIKRESTRRCCHPLFRYLQTIKTLMLFTTINESHLWQISSRSETMYVSFWSCKLCTLLSCTDVRCSYLDTRLHWNMHHSSSWSSCVSIQDEFQTILYCVISHGKS